jgi:hypothetical protein
MHGRFNHQQNAKQMRKQANREREMGKMREAAARKAQKAIRAAVQGWKDPGV